MGEMGHSRIQYTLIRLLGLLEASLGLQIMPEIRIRIASSRYRIPDIGVWLPGDIGKRIPTVPPFLAIEILSPEDRWPRMHTKIQEYLMHGVEWIWVIDPEERSAWCFSQGNPTGTCSDVLRTEDPAIEIPLSQVLDWQA